MHQSEFNLNLKHSDRQLRGYYLQLACDAERFLVEIACICLISQERERNAVKEIFFESLIMKNKIRCAAKALIKYNQQYYKEFKECFKEMYSLNEFRNQFAHSIMEGDPKEEDPDIIIFKYIKDGKTEHKKESFLRVYHELDKFRDTIQKLLSLLLRLNRERYPAQSS